MITIEHNNVIFFDLIGFFDKTSLLLENELLNVGLLDKPLSNKDLKLYLNHFFIKKMFDEFVKLPKVKVCIYVNTTILPTLINKYDYTEFVDFYVSLIKDLKNNLNLRVLTNPKDLREFINNINTDAECYESFIKSMQKRNKSSHSIINFLTSKGLYQICKMYKNFPKLKLVLYA